MKQFNFKKVVPYLVAIVIFVILTLVFFSPLFEGKKMFQSDIIHHTGASKEIADYRAQTGKEPLWTNAMFSGMPAYQISTVYSGNQVGFIEKILLLGIPHPANLFFLYFIGFFILLLTLRINPWLAVAGSIAFAFSSFFLIIIDVGHNSQAHAIGYMAPVLAGIILTFRKKYLLGGMITALFLSLEINANHPQITYYLMITGLILGIVELVNSIREKYFPAFLKSVGVIAIASILAILTNITSLWATYEYGKYTIRGKSELTTEKENRTSGLDKDYATQYSIGKSETMTLLIPNFYGGPSDGGLKSTSSVAKVLRDNGQPEQVVTQFTRHPVPPLYWGDQPFTSPVYAGAIIIFLFILGLFIVKGTLKWWLLTATIVSILLSWGHNFNFLTDFFLNHVPFYNKFRAVSMILVIAELCLPILAMLAVAELFKQENDRKKMMKPLIIATSVAAGISLLFALLPDMFMSFMGPNDTMYAQRYQIPEWLVQAVRDDRRNLLVADAFRSFLFIVLTAGLLFAVVFNKVKSQYAVLILTILILVDMFVIGKRYLNEESFTSRSKVENPYEPSYADQKILQDTTPDFRVLNLSVDLFNDASTSYFHKSIGGYHGAKLRRYQELKEYCIEKEIQHFASTMDSKEMPVINMLNTRYFIIPDTSRNNLPYLNPHALGNAWFVKETRFVNNADEEIKALQKFDPRDIAIVDKKFEVELKNFQSSRDSSDQITLLKYQPNELNYVASSRNGGLGVFSEIYYPKGWNAYIDGKPASHFRVNYVLRGMILPAGEHKVDFRFEPAVYYTGEKISLISSIALILLIIGAGIAEIRKGFKSVA